MKADETEGRKAAKAWLRSQTRLGRLAARPVVLLGLASTGLAVGQAFCAAYALAAALQIARGAGPSFPPVFSWTVPGAIRGAVLGASPLAYPLGLLGAFGILAVLRAWLLTLAERASFTASASARRRLRSDALARLLQAGPAHLRTAHSAELTALVVDRVEALDGLFGRWIAAETLAVAAPALVALAALWSDPVAALILVLTGLLVPLGMALAGLGAAAASRRQFTALTRLQARFVDRVRGIATIVLAGRAEDEARALAAKGDELRRRTMRVLRVAFLSSAILDLAAAAALVLLALRYGQGLLAGAPASAAPALAVLFLVPEFFAPLRAFAAAYQDRLHAGAAAEALAALPSARGFEPTRPVRTVEAQGVSVAFENVRLTWDPARGPALDGLSFRVPAGETLVLAGPSGAGKSSVIEILLGFVRPDSGRVTLNGVAVEDLVPQALSRMTAWVSQRPVLFAGTIRENIHFARPQATSEEVEDAARAARVTDFAAGLPDGLETRVGEGGYGLSGGQAQRVAVARAFLKNAPLLLLDEPTAHLDPATEAEILDSLRRLAVGRTVILASHAAAAHAFAARRLDLRDGRAMPARGAA